MRRQEREIKDIEDKLHILETCKVCRVAMQDELGLYIVPMNYGYTYEQEVLTLYFHSGKEGRKVDALLKNSRVAFEMDCSHKLIEAEQACGYGYAFESIMGTGEAVFVEDANEKAEALKIMMQHQTSKDFTFTEKMMSDIRIIKITAVDFTGKHHS